MGSVVISGATSGAVTLAVPDEAGTRTLTLPATTGTILTNDISQAGDTSAGNAAAVGYTSAEGLILTGQGSTSDVTIKNDADATVISIPTGTTKVGIGTTAAAVNLHVASGADGVAARFSRTSGGGIVDVENYNGIGGIGTSDNIPFRFNTNNTERVRILNDGKVGIGTTAPDSLVEISSGGATTAKVSTTVSNSYAEIIFEDGNAGYGFQVRSDGAAGLATGSMVINDRDSSSFPLVINEGCATNTLKLSGGNVSVGGALSKGSGSFKIDHPLESKKDTHYLAHSFVEGAQADNIYRGKINLVNGTATVNVDTVSHMTDGTFVALNRDIQCFTTNETGWTAVKGCVSGNVLTINAQDNTCTDTISWLVIGERQDPHMYEVDWTDENGKVITEPLKEAG